jgi:electron-transferring-flavoprotein dehydrogenase
MERESMDYDVVVVGAGPAGLSAAIKLRQLAKEKEIEITVCILEKGSEVGAHIVSGAIFETRALDELDPDWKQKGAPLNTPVARDEMHFYTSDKGAIKIPNLFLPKPMHNSGNYIVSLSNVCRWLGEQAEALGVDIFPGFSAAEVLYHEEGSVKGVTTGDMGRAVDGSKKAGFEPGMELHAKYTLFAEGCRGHLGKQLIEKFSLDAVSDAQHYGLGLKELWDIDPQKHEPGLVVHAAGWPLSESGGSGGAFLYHTEDNQVAVGLIVDLNYRNPNLSPYDEFQRLKHHPRIAKYLEGGKRVSYGARAITKGGLNSLPKMSMRGALLIGCDAGTLNFAKIKGSHTAMKSGMIAAETIVSAFESGDEGGSELVAYIENFKDSWAYEELHASRNFGAALHKWGVLIGAAWNFIEHNILAAKLPITLRDRRPDHGQIALVSKSKPINYLTPDGKLSFDKLSSVFLSNTNHEENQPCHLTLKDVAVPIATNLALYDAPEQRYCPAGVYEVVKQKGRPQLLINAQNCVHCKACDIKDPTQNIVWVVPEGTGGPNYPNM